MDITFVVKTAAEAVASRLVVVVVAVVVVIVVVVGGGRGVPARGIREFNN